MTCSGMQCLQVKWPDPRENTADLSTPLKMTQGLQAPEF